VVVLPDNDEPGETHCEMVSKSLHGTAASVRILRLAGITHSGDVYDWIEAGGDGGQLAQAAAFADEYQRPE
jgi:putative DNA primase/helicase